MMKKIIISAAVWYFILTVLGCSTQKVTSSWVNREALPQKPITSLCVIAIVPDMAARFSIEDKMETLLQSRGLKVVKSSELFPPRLSDDAVPREEMISKMKDAGCDGVLTISELDVTTEERYVPAIEPTPLPPYRYRYYGSYHTYYNYRYNQVYRPGYVTTDKTYFFETNFYDLESENLLWSIQSSAFEPADIESWFYEFSKLILKQLKKEGMLQS